MRVIGPCEGVPPIQRLFFALPCCPRKVSSSVMLLSPVSPMAWFVFATFLTVNFSSALSAADQPATVPKPAPVSYELVPGPIRLWENDAPGALGQRVQDIPTLTAFPADPAKDTGATMIVLPGGGYAHLAEHEGTGYAEWFAAHGVTAYVLKYRLGSNGYRHPAMLNDVARAVRLVRTFARRDGRDPVRLGVIGSSAGTNARWP